jgi:hypothetical protein
MNTQLNMEFSSWVDEVLPEMLWAVLLRAEVPRVPWVNLSSEVLHRVTRHADAFDRKRLDHSSLAIIEPAVFDDILEPFLKIGHARAILRPLLLFKDLPGHDHWHRHLSKPEENDWLAVMRAIGAAYDHQSLNASDCRWLRVMTEVAKGTLHVAPGMDDAFERVVYFPKAQEWRKEAPRVRAMEMMTRVPALGGGLTEWCEKFWIECFEKTKCHVPDDIGAQSVDHKGLADAVFEVSSHLASHYMRTIRTTKIDARHEGAFGIVFYLLHLAFLGIKGWTGQTILGRVTLRSMVEALIILTFLAKKDDETIWKQYRNYGAGQAKLALLKFKDDDPPSFVSKELLDDLANSDYWMEFQDINLGAWADKNLRRMSEEAGVKALYDKYYDALSGYVHGNWAAVSHSGFSICLNPLHRFHRVPTPPRLFVEDSVPDMVKLVNLALEQLNSLYPTFKPRVREKQNGAKSQDAGAADYPPES